jgi:hypothetical protein
MTLDLTDEEAALLLKELNNLIDGDRYFLSERIKTLKAIRAKIRPEPVREPLPPPPKPYARRGRVRRAEGAPGGEPRSTRIFARTSIIVRGPARDLMNIEIGMACPSRRKADLSSGCWPRE